MIPSPRHAICLTTAVFLAASLAAALPSLAADESAAPIPVPSTITASDVRPHIEFLAHPDRMGRQGAGLAAAAGYIENWFRDHKLTPLFEGSYRQAIPDGQTPAGALGTNLGAVIPGSDPAVRDEIILITAHYDHLGKRNGVIYPGADDNASSVAMLLESARQIAAMPVKPRRTVAFVAFDLEERLLHGSRWFAAHPPWDIHRIRLFITADLIGRSLGNLDLPAVFVMGSERSTKAREILDRLQPPAGLEIARLGADLVGTRSDYGPFRDFRIPFLFFSTGEHPDYHTPRDTPDRIDYPKCASISNVILTTALEAANADAAPVWIRDPAPDIEEVKALARVTRLLLDADGAGTPRLSDLQRAFIEQVHAKTSFMARRGTVTAEERVWVVRAAQWLMISVF